MKVATWNVNSLRVRLDHVLAWLKENPVDVLGIQETKLTDENFPRDEILAAGYSVNYSGQPTYNGVALLTRLDSIGEASDVIIGNPMFEDEQQRLITGTCNGLRVTCAYIPNGQDTESPKYQYKLAWLDALIQWLDSGAGAAGVPRVLVGDYNIAPADEDVHQPMAFKGKVLCSDPERERFERLIGLGMVDTFRMFEQAPKSFSWWDYRRQGFRRNAGLRIDHVLVDQSIQSRVIGCVIDKEPRTWDKPSDHTPVIAEISD